MPKTTPRRKSSTGGAPGRKRGSRVEGGSPRIILTLPADLREHIATAAEGEGVSVSEWIRRACHERVLRVEWRRR